MANRLARWWFSWTSGNWISSSPYMILCYFSLFNGDYVLLFLNLCSWRNLCRNRKDQTYYYASRCGVGYGNFFFSFFLHPCLRILELDIFRVIFVSHRKYFFSFAFWGQLKEIEGTIWHVIGIPFWIYFSEVGLG